MGTQTFTASIPIGPTPHNSWAEVLQIPQFNLGRPLLKVDLSVQIEIQNTLAFESTSGLASRATVSHASSVTLTDPASRTVVCALSNTATKTLARRDGVLDYDGPSGFTADSSRSVDDECTILDVAPYIGAGSVDLNIAGSAESRFSGPAAGSFRTATQYQVTVSGTYTYAD